MITIKQKFSLRKFKGVGLASAIIGLCSIALMNNNTVKADTINNNSGAVNVENNKNANVTASENSKTTAEQQENKSNLVETNENKASSKTINSNNNNENNASSKTISSSNNNENNANTNNKSNAETNISANTDAKSDDSNAKTSNLSISLDKKAVNPSLNALSELKVETSSAASATVPAFAAINANDWTTQVDNNYLDITGYKGTDTASNLTIPNGADFAKAGLNSNNLQAEISKTTLSGLVRNGIAPKLSNTDNQKIIAQGSSWNIAFYGKNLTDISGLANLDTSNVTDMSGMFNTNQISDLTPLQNWNVSKVTNMSYMFDQNYQISDLAPLQNWDVSKVTDMSGMFNANNQISDLAPLQNWDVSNVANMRYMFNQNKISDLAPLQNWNVSNVTDMSSMFSSNSTLVINSINLFKNEDLKTCFGKNQTVFSYSTITTNNSAVLAVLSTQTYPTNVQAQTTTATRKITLTIPNNLLNNADFTGTKFSKNDLTYTQTINYKKPVNVAFTMPDSGKSSGALTENYAANWEFDPTNSDGSKDASGNTNFNAVILPTIPGYTAEITAVPNTRLLAIRFVAIPNFNNHGTDASAVDTSNTKTDAPDTTTPTIPINTNASDTNSMWFIPDTTDNTLATLPVININPAADLLSVYKLDRQSRALSLYLKRYYSSTKDLQSLLSSILTKDFSLHSLSLIPLYK